MQQIHQNLALPRPPKPFLLGPLQADPSFLLQLTSATACTAQAPPRAPSAAACWPPPPAGGPPPRTTELSGVLAPRPLQLHAPHPLPPASQSPHPGFAGHGPSFWKVPASLCAQPTEGCQHPQSFGTKVNCAYRWLDGSGPCSQHALGEGKRIVKTSRTKPHRNSPSRGRRGPGGGTPPTPKAKASYF